tara:strand:- start:48 stop:1046 length:999 start_codon:yes stop_codon:yes gene_type:complete
MLMGFPREIGLRRNICGSRQDFNNYVTQLNGKASCYTSLYSFERLHPVTPWKMDADSAIIDRAWWDFDMLEGGTLSDVKDDVRTLVNRLNGDVRLVFTGRGFHIHQFFDKPVYGTSVTRHIERYQKERAKGLKTLDGVGHPQKLTRIPDTFNPKRKSWAVNIPADAFAEDPHNFLIPSQPVEEYRVLDPFRGMSAASDFDFVQWMADNPQQEIYHACDNFEGEIGTADLVPIPPCLQSLIYHENPKHKVRLALAQHLAENLRNFAHPSTLTSQQKTEIAGQIATFMSTLGWRDFNMHITRQHIESIMGYEFAPNCCLVDVGPCWAHNSIKGR